MPRAIIVEGRRRVSTEVVDNEKWQAAHGAIIHQRVLNGPVSPLSRFGQPEVAAAPPSVPVGAALDIRRRFDHV